MIQCWKLCGSNNLSIILYYLFVDINVQSSFFWSYAFLYFQLYVPPVFSDFFKFYFVLEYSLLIKLW